MEGSFIVTNGSLTLVLDTQFIPKDIYETSTLNIDYFYDVGGSAPVASVCNATFTDLSALQNYTPCNATFIHLMPSLLNPADTCVAFSCTSSGTKSIHDAEFININIGGGFCSPTNSSDCYYKVANSHGGVDLAHSIYPVDIFNVAREKIYKSNAAWPYTFPGNSTSDISHEKSIIAGLSGVCAVLIIGFGVFLYINKARKTSGNNAYKSEESLVDTHQTDSYTDRAIPSSSSTDNSDVSPSHTEKQFCQQVGMFRGMTQLQRAATFSSLTFRDNPADIEIHQHEVVTVATISSQQLPEYMLYGLPPAYSDTGSSDNTTNTTGSK